MRIGAIVQARLNSTRLPGKVMKEILGRPLLFYLIERLKSARLLEKIVVATTQCQHDKVICDYAKNLGVEYFRGSQDDVLDRYYQAARKFAIDIIVRITADCPLLDPELVDEVVRYYLEHRGFDLVRTGPTYPEGFDVEVFAFKSLEIAWRQAKLKSEREHVTSYIWKNDQSFKIKTLAFKKDLSYLRITVDEKEDFQLITDLLTKLYSSQKIFSLADILQLHEEQPEIFRVNQHVIRNEGYLESLKEDEEL